jgi:large subunit ribosomal protein L6
VVKSFASCGKDQERGNELMAGIGRWPVVIPEQVKIVEDAGSLTVQGPKGTLNLDIDPVLSIQVKDSNVSVIRSDESRRTKAVHGLTRKLIANMVEGVSKGFTRSLEISGVGYRAEVTGDVIQLTLGLSHPIMFQLPPGVQAKIERQTLVTLEGIDKQLLGEVAAAIRRLRPPDPYKAKGVKYAEEKIRRKAGKTAGAR